MPNIVPRITMPGYQRPSLAELNKETRKLSNRPKGPWWIIQLDRIITRRKRYALVINPEGETVQSERLAGGALLWLDMQGVKEYLIETEDAQFLVRVDRLEGKRKVDQWQKLPPDSSPLVQAAPSEKPSPSRSGKASHTPAKGSSPRTRKRRPKPS